MDFARTYRYFLITLIVLIFLPYSISSNSSYSDSGVAIGGLFYSLRFENGIIVALEFVANPVLSSLNVLILIGSCLYFTFYRKRAERIGADYSLKIAGLYFALVIITLLIVDWNGMMAFMYFVYSPLSMFGMLLAYLTIIFPVFQMLSNKKLIPIISPNTNKYMKYVYSNIGTVFGVVILLAPILLLLSFNTIDIDSFNIQVSWMGSNYMMDWSLYLTDFSFSLLLGLQPPMLYFIIFWLPQIVLAIQMLRYLGNQTSKRLLLVGFAISLFYGVLYFPMIILSILYTGSLGSILVPIPILQLLSLLILRIERSKVVRAELDVEDKHEEEEFITVPIRRLIISRLRKWRNSDW